MKKLPNTHNCYQAGEWRVLGKHTVHRRVGVERPGNALQLAHHALGRLSIREHKIDGAHTLSIQPCACVLGLSELHVWVPLVDGTHADGNLAAACTPAT